MAQEETQKETARGSVFFTSEYDIKRKFHHIILLNPTQSIDVPTFTLKTAIWCQNNDSVTVVALKHVCLCWQASSVILDAPVILRLSVDHYAFVLVYMIARFLLFSNALSAQGILAKTGSLRPSSDDCNLVRLLHGRKSTLILTSCQSRIKFRVY